MFCFQCEQTAQGKGCTAFGVCGKNPEVAALQDLLVYLLRGLSQLSIEGRKIGVKDEQLNLFICESAFATLTNVNFDPDTLIEYIVKAARLRDALREKVRSAGGHVGLHGPVEMLLERTPEGLIGQGKQVGVNADPSIDPDLNGLHWLLIYGLKGVSAYAYHAYLFGKKDDGVFEFIQQGFAATLDKSLGVNDFLDLVLKCGEVNIRAMELLDAGNTETFGHPVPTKVPLGHKKGKAILLSGHDLIDLEHILKQTQDKDITIYTHGEMLPAHGYPELKKYPNFYGHYGTAWQNQQKEFAAFPGAILMTTNCIQRPLESYKGNIFTSGPVGYPGVPHVSGKDFTAVINKALELPGFPEDIEGKTVLVGFGRNAVLSLADNIVNSVMNGHINSFFLVAGCDGAKPGRNYYTEFVEKSPKDSIILTLACGKFRFFDKDIGEIDGIPRLLDIGQCNDSYSAVKIAQAFAEIFNCGINELPLYFILSWYEQKAVAILLSLFYLGVKNIRLGPSFPAFITPNILKVLIEKFNIMPIKNPEEDLKTIIDYVNGISVKA
ncbi:MAG TPA: hydroxylamine reductase [Candidatus Nanoarchaeia archaeon]|nr:hydroxylamine reductase [Candidatus Nanoarchaeia archaeon]